MQIAEISAAGRVEIPTDGASEWEIDVKLLKFGNKVASGSYGDLWVFVASYYGENPLSLFHLTICLFQVISLISVLQNKNKQNSEWHGKSTN